MKNKNKSCPYKRLSVFYNSCLKTFGSQLVHPKRCNITQFIYLWKLLYMFRVVSPPIIRSTHNCIYRIWYLSNRYCYLLPSWRSWNCRARQVPAAVDTTVCAPDDGWRYLPKHVEQFPEIYKLCNVASCWTYIKIYLRCTDPER